MRNIVLALALVLLLLPLTGTVQAQTEEPGDLGSVDFWSIPGLPVYSEIVQLNYEVHPGPLGFAETVCVDLNGPTYANFSPAYSYVDRENEENSWLIVRSGRTWFCWNTTDLLQPPGVPFPITWYTIRVDSAWRGYQIIPHNVSFQLGDQVDYDFAGAVIYNYPYTPVIVYDHALYAPMILKNWTN